MGVENKRREEKEMRSFVLVLCVLGALAGPIAPEDAPFASFLQTGVTTGAGLNISSLTVSAGANRESKITLGDAETAFALALRGDSGDFEIRHNSQRSFVVTRGGDVDVFGSLISKGAVSIGGVVNYMGVDQWSLAAVENFNNGASGWSNDSISSCGSEDKKILGGFGKFAGGEASKLFFNLPPHSQVRMRANFHFIDAWGGETAYAKLEHRVMWTDSFDQQSSKVGVNICGGPAPESKFSAPIDVILPHKCDESDACSLHVSFGSTLTLAPTEQSWGVSDVMIYVR